MKSSRKILVSGFSVVIIILLVAIFTTVIIMKQNSELNAKFSTLENSTNTKIDTLAKELNLIKDEAKTGKDLSGVIKNATESTVIIKTAYKSGSGFFIANGYVITNEHVIEKSDGIISKNISVITYDNSTHNATLVGYIKNLDLALIKTTSGYNPLSLVSSNKVSIGEKVIAIGTPEGLSFSATDGIVSAVNRTGFGKNGTYIQTNAQLNPGNSGGPLININKSVIGMNNFKITDSEGLGFALEADKIKSGVNEISNQYLNETLI